VTRSKATRILTCRKISAGESVDLSAMRAPAVVRSRIYMILCKTSAIGALDL